jgi:hypothetical protein
MCEVIEKTTRLLRCPECGKRKALVKKSYFKMHDYTTITLVCANLDCNRVISIQTQKGNQTGYKEILQGST